MSIDENKPGDVNQTDDGKSQNTNTGGQPDKDKMVPLAALHEEREKRQALAAEVESMKDIIKSSFDQQTQSTPQPQQTNTSKLDELWDSDPKRAVRAEMMMAMKWMDSVNASVSSQETVLMKSNPDYVKYRGQVMESLNKLDLQQRAQPGIVKTAYHAIKGSDVEAIKKEWEKDVLEKIKRGESVSGLDVGTVSTSGASKAEATSEQTAIAERMGMSVEDYMKYARKA